MHLTRSLRPAFTTLWLALVLMLALPGAAANFCVGSVAQLESAFATARTNNEDDHIRIRRGSYQLTAPLDFGYGAGDDGKSLTVSGGWIYFFNSCADVGVDPSGTVVIADPDSVWAFRIQPDHGASSPETVYRFAELTIEGGLFLSDTASSANYRHEVVGNVLRGDDSSMRISFDGSNQLAVVESNLFYANTDLGSGVLELSLESATSRALVTNNTIADNDQAVQAVNAFCSVAGAEVTFENNLFHGNTPVDLKIAHACVSTVAFNSYATLIGSPDYSCCNLNVDPAFQDAAAGDFRLRFESPVRDVGDLSPEAGLTAVDIEGNPRINGVLPDLGAYEVPWVFANGFEGGDLFEWSAADE